VQQGNNDDGALSPLSLANSGGFGMSPRFGGSMSPRFGGGSPPNRKNQKQIFFTQSHIEALTGEMEMLFVRTGSLGVLKRRVRRIKNEQKLAKRKEEIQKKMANKSLIRSRSSTPPMKTFSKTTSRTPSPAGATGGDAKRRKTNSGEKIGLSLPLGRAESGEQIVLARKNSLQELASKRKLKCDIILSWPGRIACRNLRVREKSTYCDNSKHYTSIH
jgi:hypothetical protein